MTTEVKTGSIWTCKIGEAHPTVKGADGPMREAVEAAFKKVTGQDPLFIFSGWGGSLSVGERAVVENDEPGNFIIEEEEILDQLVAGARNFCERVEKGEIRSVKTYNNFRELLAKLDALRKV